MKKALWLLAAAVPVILVACGGEEKKAPQVDALLDRLDVLDLPSRNQAIALMRAMTSDREIDSVIVAGTLKEPMAKTPDWLQAVWIEAGHIAGHEHQAAA